MPIFPDMPVPSLSGPLAPSNGALPAGDSSGVVPGLDGALMALLRNYKPGDIGICELDPKIQLTLPVPYWAEYSWISGRTVTGDIPAGSGATFTLETVPMDERWMLELVVMHQVSGDNDMQVIGLQANPAYNPGAGNGQLDILRLSSKDTDMWWPNLNGDQTVASDPAQSPILLEPGTLITCIPGGTGVAISTFSYSMIARRSKLVRAMGP